MGYTGEPTNGFNNIDECAHADMNTCSGGMYPHGFDTDVFGPDNAKQYYVGKGDDGFSHSFIFEVRGYRNLKISLCQGTDLCYRVRGGKDS